MRSVSLLLIGPLVLAAALLPVVADPLAPPRLQVEQIGEESLLWVDSERGDGGTRRTLLRRTTGSLSPLRTGRDPAGKAAFATWTEGSQETWHAYSRDGGRTWSRSRPLQTALLFRDGATLPGQPLPAVRDELALSAEGSVFVVQFHTTSIPEWRDGLTDLGVKLLRPFPHNAHLVTMDHAQAAQAAALEFVERVEPFHAAYRVEGELREWLEQSGPFAPEAELRVRVEAFEWGPGGKSRILESIEPLGARTAKYWPSGHILELWVDRDQLRALAAHDDVMWIDRWQAPADDMDLMRKDTGADFVEFSLGYCGQGVRGEVMDSGIQLTHMDFENVLEHGTNNVSSHGTSTYGIVFGNGARDGDGDATATGLMPCPEAQGIFADYGFLGDRFDHTFDLKKPPYHASFQTNSWGSGLTTSYSSASSEMDDIIWRLDIAITQSQSNEGNQLSRPEAWAKNIISVGGIRHFNTQSTADDAWSGGASIGPAQDGRIKPDVNYWYDAIYTTTTNNGYTSGFGGTSAATPEVAGVLGLMVQMWSDNVWGTDPVGETPFERQPHASTLKALLINNAQQYPFTGSFSDLTRTHQGWGRPSASLAASRAATSLIVDEERLLTVDEIATYPVTVPESETELKITMVYPDPPGTTAAALHRINDLHLKVTSPNNDVYYGNRGLDTGNYSETDGTPNLIDTVENVFVLDPAPGLWLVEIEAAEINQDAVTLTPEDDVTFALVVTGGLDGSSCGNGIRDTGEQCDGFDLGGATCGDAGCGTGPVSCTAQCTYDLDYCLGCPVCGDGDCAPTETCQNCAADCISDRVELCGNGICEPLDGEDCANCADCNGQQSGNPGNRYCCGAGGGDTPVDCSDSRCQEGNSCIETPNYGYCCGDLACEGAEDGASCMVDCAPATPGEAARIETGMIRVTDYDPGTETISLTFGPACSAASHVIEYAELTRANLQSYAWSGQQCGLPDGGSYDWTHSGTPGSFFFVIVGQGGSTEGSYGTDSDGVERLEDAGGGSCPMAQDLVLRCD